MTTHLYSECPACGLLNVHVHEGRLAQHQTTPLDGPICKGSGEPAPEWRTELVCVPMATGKFTTHLDSRQCDVSVEYVAEGSMFTLVRVRIIDNTLTPTCVPDYIVDAALTITSELTDDEIDTLEEEAAKDAAAVAAR